MDIKQFVRDYFTFTRNERKGIVVLLVIIFVLAIANKMIFYFEKPAKLDSALFDSAKHELVAFNDSLNVDLSEAEFRSARSHDKEKPSSGSMEKTENRRATAENTASMQLFRFDPNTCSDEDFMKLGFSGKQTDVIRRYIGKGVVFKSKEDFFKIRVITDKQKEALSPWVWIPEKFAEPKSSNEKGKTLSIEINSTDSIALEKLPGIGRVLSKRIIKYRDLLGGFYSADQLNEVYGLNESAITEIKKDIKIDKSAIKKIDFNFGEISDLSRHPYIKRDLAVKIIKFRAKYGKFTDLSVLRDSLIFTEEEYTRIKPYF